MGHHDPESLLTKLKELERLRNPSFTKGLRQYVRHVIRGEAHLHPMEPGNVDLSAIPVLLRDVGRGGLGFLSPVKLDFLSKWRVDFIEGGLSVGQQSIIVRHCHQIDDNAYLVGSQFCIDSGLMYLLGVDRSAMAEEQNGAEFLPPPAEEAA